MKVRLSEKVSEIFGQVSEKTKLESLAGLIAATSVASERVFSTSGYIVNPRRNKLKAENVDMVTFLAKKLQ